MANQIIYNVVDVLDDLINILKTNDNINELSTLQNTVQTLMVTVNSSSEIPVDNTIISNILYVLDDFMDVIKTDDNVVELYSIGCSLDQIREELQ